MYLTQALHRNLQQKPNEIATTFGDRTVTHAEMHGRVARLAGGLRELGVDPGDRVAILALNSDRYLQFVYAVAWADAVVVPVNIRWSAKEIAYSLIEADVRTLAVDDVFAPLAAAVREHCPDLDVLVHCGDAAKPEGTVSFESLAMESDPIEDAHRRGDAVAGIFYTGGTTGFPKGVMLSHRNLATSALGSAVSGTAVPGGTVLHAAPMFHLADFASTVANSALGNTHAIISVFDPVATLTAIAELRVTDVLLVPTMIQMVVDHPRRAEFDLSSIERLTYGGSPIADALLARSRKAFPAAQFIQAYGMTELAPVATVLLDEFHSDPVLRRSAGRAAPHTAVKIVDWDGTEVPRGTVGEIVVSGDNVMLGYWNKPQETAEAVRDGWMHTGDGGYMDENGFVFIADRIKDMIVSGGENIYSLEVENAIAKHPAVVQCAVIGVPDEQWGERVHAVVALTAGSGLDLATLREHCKGEIAGYKVPRSLAIVDEFPTSAAGKILKVELRKQHEADAIRDGASLPTH